MARVVLAALLAGCWLLAHGAAPTPISAKAPEANPVVQLVEALPLPPPPEPPRTEPLADCPAAIALVIDFEILSPAYFERHLLSPIYPGGASGPTWCIGYDGGHQLPSTILLDWRDHPHRDTLAATAGVTGHGAKAMVPRIKHVITRLPYCAEVFEAATVPRYWQMTRRAYPGIEALAPCARGAIFSLTYNRGAAMGGDRNREKRAIRDDCIPRGDNQCVANQIQAMTRLWKGTDIEKGMARRRAAEARLALQPTSPGPAPRSSR